MRMGTLSWAPVRYYYGRRWGCSSVASAVLAQHPCMSASPTIASVSSDSCVSSALLTAPCAFSFSFLLPSSKSHRRNWSLFLGWCMGALFAWASAGAVVVWCRPYDTPSYLIPYYLRDVRSRFLHYATVRKRKGGPMYMTVEDFVLALLASTEKELPDPGIVEDLQRLFVSMDANGDGYISFPEFRFLMSLLTSDPREMAELFRIVDSEKTGSLGLEAFANVLRGVTKDEAVVRSLLKPSTRRSGIVKSLFGDAAHPHPCTFAEVESFIRTIRAEVWRAEFRQFDVEKKGSITAEAFAELIAKQVLGSHLPYYLVGNIRKLHGSGSVVTLDMWLGLNDVMLRGEELSRSVELFSGSGLPVTKAHFQRLMRIAELPSLPMPTVDLIFALFDRNNDGTMEMDEFMFIMRKKMTYHYRAPTRDRKSLPLRFAECTQAAIAEFRGDN